ncbi:CsbD family protein [Paracoccus sp. T5]|uniref:CsbD family protein n=1 Tax=Paracoccus sp. T5 TaxID=3402161 RepID=UPI003AF60B47
MNEDRTKGQAKDVIGSAKETIGKAIGDKETERSGQADQVEGKVRKGVGKAKDALSGDNK